MHRIAYTIASLAVFCGAAAAEERSCEMLSLGITAGNCHDGDIAKITGAGGRDVAEVIAKYCDFGSQILTLPDPISSLAGSDPRYMVLCKMHKRERAPSN
ncbi:hypothetical protein [Mesorhizobium sp. 43Arga]